MDQNQTGTFGAGDVFAPSGHAVPEHGNQHWVDAIAGSAGNPMAGSNPFNAASMANPPTMGNAPRPTPSGNAGQQLQPNYFPTVPVASVPMPSAPGPSVPAQQSASNGVSTGTWSDSYDRSLGNIQDHVHAVAGAVAMLDAVEHKMIAIKCELQRIREAGLVIDSEKVLLALQSLSDYVNQAISSVDDQCVNMLRDAKLEIRFAELETQGQHPDGVKLTMISIERLLDYKIKSALTEGLVAEETPEFVDDICSIISSNIQVLTSVMLALFASRDYTQAVTKLAARESIIPSIKDEPAPQIASATIDRLQFDSVDQRGGQGDQLQEGRASLAELLKSVRENRNGVGAPFS